MSFWVRCRLVLFCLAWFAATTGCRQQAAAPANGTASASAEQSSDDQIGESSANPLREPVTSGEYFDAALAIEAAAASGDPQALANFFDMEAILQIAAHGLQDLPHIHDFTKGFRKGQGQEALNMGAQIARELGTEGSYQLVHLYKRRGRHIAQFRLVSVHGMNYHELYLQKNAQGQIVVVDMHIMLSGELLSQTLRRGILATAGSSNRSLLQKLMQSENEYVKHIDKILEFQAAVNENRPEQALVIYRELPETLRSDKTLLLVRIIAASRAEDWDDYAAAIDSFKQRYPDEAAVDLMSIDILLRDKKFDELHAAIDRIDKAVGGDPHLDAVRASVYFTDNDLGSAEKFALQAAADPKALPIAFWHLITIAMAAEDYEKTLKYLLQIEERFDLEFSDLTEIPDYAGFVKSPQYQTWLRRHDELPAGGQP